MGRIVIAVYRPKPGQADALAAVVRDRLPLLRRLGLATDRASIVMRAADGTLLEVSEWASEEAVQAAHRHPEVLALWDRFAAVCDLVRPVDVPELHQMFPHFDPAG